MVNPSLQFSNSKDYWQTPRTVFEDVQEAFINLKRYITLDVAASDDNALCDSYWTEKDDALVQSWEPPFHWEEDNLYWCNPPYSLKEEFLIKAHKEYELGREGLMLLPSSQETTWFRNYITKPGLRRLVWPGRIQFLIDGKRMTRTDKNGKTVVSGNTGGSVLVAFVKDALPEIAGEPWVR